MSILLGNPPGRIPHIVGSYARQALKDGLALRGQQGLQPVQVRLRRRVGLAQHRRPLPPGQLLRRPHLRRRDGRGAHVRHAWSAACSTRASRARPGLTGVWAEENTRASLFEAMQRRETFAVSGPHIKVRLFGGWEYTSATLNDKDWVKTGYAKGVPMGSDLPPLKGKAPTFVVWAVKDPTSGQSRPHPDRQGLDEERPELREDLRRRRGRATASPTSGPASCRRSAARSTSRTPPTRIRSASVELKTVWTDPEFDPSLHAFYYARVLEIPTPRWTTIQAKQLGIAPPDVVAADAPGARLELAHLVHAERRGAEDGPARPHGRRVDQAGRRGARPTRS